MTTPHLELDTHESWRQIASFTRDFLQLPLHSPRENFLYTFECACEIVHAVGGVSVFVQRQQPITRHHAMQGWHPIHTTYLNETPQDIAAKKALFKDLIEPDTPTIDESMMAHIRHAGQDRAYLWGELLPGKLFTDTPAHAALYAPRDLNDRMFGVLHIHSDLELYICLNRSSREELFGVQDAVRIRALLPSLRAHALRYAMMLGLMPNHTPLTQRERDTLHTLLEGLSEKQIARELGITTRSAHQYVLKVYRKLQVNSRAQLMALWLNPPYLNPDQDVLTHQRGRQEG
jgi:DNA-binding CsgD family transcriptional regulator